MKILFVLTSHSDLGKTGEKTGFWIEEFATPYYILADAGAEITIASPKGDQPPADPRSEAAEAQTASTERFYTDNTLIDEVAHSQKLSRINPADYDAVFYPGGHGPLWDLVNDKDSIRIIAEMYDQKKPIAFVCHGPAALLHVKTKNDEPLVREKQVTSFSNSEEAAVDLVQAVPFLLEDELKKLGAHYTNGKDWLSYVKQDGLLITGQNPASSAAVAELLLKTLQKKRQPENGQAGKEKLMDAEGYPLYPEGDDIYNQNIKESDLDPEDPSKTKVQTAEDYIEDMTGNDLDVPGSELDDDLENIGSEDEENNYYSLGGDEKEI